MNLVAGAVLVFAGVVAGLALAGWYAEWRRRE